MSQPLVSLIVPIYNGMEYIEQLAKNISEFDYGNMEIIIGDDFSSDDTYSEVIKNKIHFPSLQIFSSPVNIGAGAMRNKLISLASGKYIAIQDCDDLSARNRISMQVEFLESNQDINLVGTSASLVWNKTKWGSVICPVFPRYKNWIMQNSCVHASIMFRRNVSANVFYSDKLKTGEDYYFLTSAYIKKYKFANIPEELYIYNVAPNDLKNRSLNSFSQVLYAKLEISRLFHFPHSFFFLIINISKLSLSLIFSIIRNVRNI